MYKEFTVLHYIYMLNVVSHMAVLYKCALPLLLIETDPLHALMLIHVRKVSDIS